MLHTSSCYAFSIPRSFVLSDPAQYQCAMSSEKQGWLSAVSRLFSGGQQCDVRLTGRNPLHVQHSPKRCDLNSTHINFSTLNGDYTLSPERESNSAPSRSLRYLSPSVLETGTSQPSASMQAAFDKSSIPSTTSRKRALEQGSSPFHAADGLFSQDNPKRSRAEEYTVSMHQDRSPRLLSDHVDSRLNRTMGSHLSYVEFPHSPISNRSLIERIGSSRSNASSLSSKTRAILNHLERISTPAREARKLPVMRGTTLPSERWAPMRSSAAVPPLLRASANVPSRIQLLSTSLACQRKPYWRDITRRTKEKEKSASTKESDGKFGSDVVHPLFDMDNASLLSVHPNMPFKFPHANVDSELIARNGHSAPGNDRKEGSANVFSASELIDEEVVLSTKDSHNHFNTSGPPTEALGLRDDMVFTFDAPVERQLGQFLVDDNDFTLIEHRESRNTSEESNTSDSEDEKRSSISEAEETNAPPNDEKNSRPSTAADSETSTEISATATPASSKDVSPQTREEASWNCTNCFNTNKNLSRCASCGCNKDGTAASKSLITNVTSCIKAGADSETQLEAAGKTSTECRTASNSESVCVPTSSQASVISCPAVSVAEPRLKTDGLGSERSDWECPDCMVRNKASDNRCVCCGHVMYKSDEKQTSSNVFGDRAFKAGTSSTFSFAFGGSRSTTSDGGAIRFGFGESNVVENAVSSLDASKKPTEILPVNSNSLSSSETEKETSSKTSPDFNCTVECPKPRVPEFSTGGVAPIFGSEARPPLFGPLSSSVFKSSSSIGSFCPVSSTTTSTNKETNLAAVNSSQDVSTSAPTSFVFGMASSASALAQPSLLSFKKEENPTNKPPLFGSSISFGTLPSSDAKALACDTSKSGSNADAVGVTPSTSVIFSATGAAKPVFSSFGIPSESSKPFMGTNISSESLKSPFEMSVSTSAEVQKPLFGVSASTSASKPLFGANTSSNIPSSNGGLSFNFGSTNAFGGFGAAAPSTTIASSLPPSSNVSIFGSATNVPEAPKPFQFNATLPGAIFQFGQAPLSGSTPFQFGSSQLAATAAPSFQAPGVVAAAAPSSNFSFTSSNTRKTVSARRRLPQRK